MNYIQIFAVTNKLLSILLYNKKSIATWTVLYYVKYMNNMKNLDRFFTKAVPKKQSNGKMLHAELRI